MAFGMPGLRGVRGYRVAIRRLALTESKNHRGRCRRAPESSRFEVQSVRPCHHRLRPTSNRICCSRDELPGRLPTCRAACFAMRRSPLLTAAAPRNSSKDYRSGNNKIEAVLAAYQANNQAGLERKDWLNDRMIECATLRDVARRCESARSRVRELHSIDRTARPSNGRVRTGTHGKIQGRK